MVDVRPMRPEDAPAALDLRVAAFSTQMQVPTDEARPDDYAPDDHRLVAVEADRVVGHVAVWPFHQSFGGRPVPMGGVAGLAVAVDRRGRGVGSALLAGCLDLMAERGLVLSTLYPSTPIPYRGWGWEIAGEHVRRRIATRDLLDLPPGPGDVELALFDPDDLDGVVALHDGITAAEPGGLAGGRRWLGRGLLPDPDEPEIAIVARRDDTIVGLSLAAKTSPEPDGHSAYGLRVLRLLGTDRDVDRTLWRNIGMHHPVAAMTSFNSLPAEPLLFDLPAGLHLPPPSTHHWMSRLVDAPAAVAARGWPLLTGQVELAIIDDRRPANAGPHVLEVQDGEAQLEPGGSGRVAIDIGALSSIYTGFATPSAMARAGRLVGASATELTSLDQLFVAPAPFLRDYF